MAEHEPAAALALDADEIDTQATLYSIWRRDRGGDSTRTRPRPVPKAAPRPRPRRGPSHPPTPPPRATERLERAYVRDLVPEAEYEELCGRLLAQHRTLRAAASKAASGCAAASQDPADPAYRPAHLPPCPLAIRRLRAGVPASQEHGGVPSRRGVAPDSGGAPDGGGGGGSGARGTRAGVPQAAASAALAEEFVTALDSIDLDADRHADALAPALRRLLAGLRPLGVPATAPCRRRLAAWCARLDGLGASYRLTDEERRQLRFDVDASYGDFKAGLEGGGWGEEG